MNQEYYNNKICETLLEVLINQYPFAKEALLNLESKERLRALGAFTDLRDVFDHFYLAVGYSLSSDVEAEEKEQLISDQLNSAKEHFRRAAIEPLETSVEDLIAKIIEKAKYNYFLRYIRLSKVENIEITEILTLARNTLADIRKKKGQLNQLEDTINKLQSLNDKLRLFEVRLATKLTSKLFFSLFLCIFFVFFAGFFFGSLLS